MPGTLFAAIEAPVPVQQRDVGRVPHGRRDLVGDPGRDVGRALVERARQLHVGVLAASRQPVHVLVHAALLVLEDLVLDAQAFALGPGPQALPLVERGAPIYGFDYAGYWRDLGTADSLAAARDDVVRGRFAPGYLDPC